MATSFEQFRASLTRPIARSALGIEMSENEALRVTADEALSRAYYENWLRTQRPATAGAPAATLPFAAVTSPSASPALAPQPFAYVGVPMASQTTTTAQPPSQPRKSGAIWTILPIVFVTLCVCAYLGYQGSKPSANSESSQGSTTASGSTADKAPVVSETDQRDAAATSEGWKVVQSGELYVKAADAGSFTCDHYKCLWYQVQSMSGCPGGVYIKADIVSNGTAVGWTNAFSPSIKPGETVAVKLEDIEGTGDAFRLSEANCT